MNCANVFSPRLLYLFSIQYSGYGLACVIDILCNTVSGIGAGFLTGGGGLLFQAYDIASFCEISVSKAHGRKLCTFYLHKNLPF